MAKFRLLLSAFKIQKDRDSENGCSKCISTRNRSTQEGTWFVFTNHPKEQSLCFSTRFCKLESNTTYDWPIIDIEKSGERGETQEIHAYEYESFCRDMTEIILKEAQNTNQSINQLINLSF